MFKKKVFLFVFVFLFLMILLPIVTSAPPSDTVVVERGIDIVHPETKSLKSNTDVEFNFWTYNSTDGETLTNETLNCSVYLIDNAGVNFYKFSNNAGASGLMTYGKGSPLCTNCWTMTLPNENLTEGVYSYQIKCQGEGIGGYTTGFFEATESGVEMDEGRSISAIGLLTLLVFLLFISLYSLFSVESYIGKFVLYWVSHVLMIIISFAGWQIGVEGLLEGVGLIGVFRIMFYVLTVAVFPMVLLSIAWIFYIHTMNDDVRKMVDKGMPVEEAFKKSSNRRYF